MPVWMKCVDNNVCFTLRPMYIYNNISAELFSKWDVFQKEVVKEARTYILCPIHFFWQLCHLRDSVEIYGTARQATGQYNEMQKRWELLLDY